MDLTRIEEDRKEIEKFTKWIKTVPREQLEHLIIDDYWKDNMMGSELKRYFMLSLHGINLVDLPKQTRGGV